MKRYSIIYMIFCSILLIGCSASMTKKGNQPNCVDWICTVSSNMTMKEELDSWTDSLHCDRLDIVGLSSGEIYSGTIQAIVSVYDEKILTDSNDVDSYLKRWFLNYYIGSYSLEGIEKAILDFDKAIDIVSHTGYTISKEKLNRIHENVYCYRWSARATKNDFTGAIEDFTTMIEMNPQSINGYFNRATMNTLYTWAIDDYTKIISLQPNNSKAYRNRGILKWSLWKKTDWKDDLKKACELEAIYCQKYTSGEMFTL